MKQRSIAALGRLGKFLKPFERCFLHPAQRGAAERYVDGLLGSSPKKQMTKIWERLENQGKYQSLHHFITSSTWDEGPVWKQLRGTFPAKKGILLHDDTGIPKQGNHSVGVQRQYSGTLGKIGNCQVAVSSLFCTEDSAWLAAMDLYLPTSWTEDRARRKKAGIPKETGFRPKWQIALDQVTTMLAEDFELECVVADAGYGECTDYRDELARMGLSYVLGVSETMTAWTKPPHIVEEKKGRRGRPRGRHIARNSAHPCSLKTIAEELPVRAWQKVSWKGSTGRNHQGRFAALRVVPAHRWTSGEIHSEHWLLIEKRKNEIKFYLSNLPPETPVERLVFLAKIRWAIERNYRDIKEELGFDHFTGRRFNGWNHHAVLTAITYAFLEHERLRKSKPGDRISFQVARHFIYRMFVALEVAADDELYQDISDFRKNPPKRLWI